MGLHGPQRATINFNAVLENLKGFIGAVAIEACNILEAVARQGALM